MKTPNFQLSKYPAFKNIGIKQKKQSNNFRDTTENKGALPERRGEWRAHTSHKEKSFQMEEIHQKALSTCNLFLKKPEEISMNSNDLPKAGEREKNVGSDHKKVTYSNSGRANKASFSKCGN